MKDITSYNKEGQRHGYWELYFSTGNIACKGHYHNNERIGYWEWYTFYGELQLQIFHS
jgi:antitoxin component YwqK of YwqJK toxin-antitoxin module